MNLENTKSRDRHTYNVLFVYLRIKILYQKKFWSDMKYAISPLRIVRLDFHLVTYLDVVNFIRQKHRTNFT